MDSKPIGYVQDPRELLRARIANLAHAPEGQLKEIALVYLVSGGPPGKRITTILRVSGAGEVTLQHSDELRKQKTVRRKMALARDEVMAIFRKVQDSGLLECQDTGGGFLPDSVIGSISLEAGDARVTYHFLAEEHQQQSQGKEPAAKVLTLI